MANCRAMSPRGLGRARLPKRPVTVRSTASDVRQGGAELSVPFPCSTVHRRLCHFTPWHSPCDGCSVHPRDWNERNLVALSLLGIGVLIHFGAMVPWWMIARRIARAKGDEKAVGVLSPTYFLPRGG